MKNKSRPVRIVTARWQADHIMPEPVCIFAMRRMPTFMRSLVQHREEVRFKKRRWG